MASDNDASCICDPNFAVICSFLEKFGKSCGILYPDFNELQEMLENTVEVPIPLIELHIKLLRKVRRSVNTDRWERAIVKFCHTYSSQDGWEVERFGYKKSRISVKLRILKCLLEAQFDFNTKFKNEVNKLPTEDLRLEPLGKDNKGYCYWYQIDDICNLRVYREDPDEETWELLANDRAGLVSLISKLSNNKDDTIEPITNDDSNSLEIEKPITDTGQIVELQQSATSSNDENSKENLSIDSSSQENTVNMDDKEEKIDEKINIEMKVNENQVNDQLESKSVKDEPIDVKNNSELVEDVVEKSNSREDSDHIIEKSVDLKTSTDNLIKTDEQLINLEKSFEEKSVDLVKSTEILENVIEKPIDLKKDTENVDANEESIDLKKNINELTEESIDLKKEMEVVPEEPLDLKKNVDNPEDVTEKLIETNEESTIDKTNKLDAENNENVVNNQLECENTDENDEKCVEIKSNESQKRCSDETVSSQVEKKLKSDEDAVVVSSEIVEPTMIIKGDGSGEDCNSVNICTDNCVVEDEIVEEIMFFYGQGNGYDCMTANTEKNGDDETTSGGGKETEHKKTETVDKQVVDATKTDDIVENKSSAPLPATKRFLQLTKEDSSAEVDDTKSDDCLKNGKSDEDTCKNDVNESVTHENQINSIDDDVVDKTEPVEDNKVEIEKDNNDIKVDFNDKEVNEEQIETKKESPNQLSPEVINVASRTRSSKSRLLSSNEQTKNIKNTVKNNKNKDVIDPLMVTSDVNIDNEQSPSSPAESSKPLLMCVDINKLKEKNVVSSEDVKNKDDMVVDEDPLSGVDLDLTKGINKSEEEEDDDNEEEETEEVENVNEDEISKPETRKRGRSNTASPEVDETSNKRCRTRSSPRKIAETKSEESCGDDDKQESENGGQQTRRQVARRGGVRPMQTRSATKPPAAAPATIKIVKPKAFSKPVDKVESPPELPKKKTKKIMGLDIDMDAAKIDDKRTPTRQSSRIAQIKIKEEAERRKLEEIAYSEMKATNKKSKDKDYDKKKRKTKNDSDDDDYSESEDSNKKKRKKKKNFQKFDSLNPWKSSSSDSSTSDEEDPEIEEEEVSDENLVFKSDHEFSPESDLEDSEVQPLRRARTAKVESDIEDDTDDYACQKCGKSDHPEWILLCDSCDCGWHCSCLHPPLFVIPEGDWFCPPCQHTTLITRLKLKLEEYDAQEKKLQNEILQRERVQYVSISMSNILPSDKSDRHEQDSKGSVTSEREMAQDNQSRSESDDDDDSSRSSRSSDGSSEPIYQLRQRRQANSYRFNEYDDLINSAIQDELEAVKGAGNQGRGKDINTIVNAEKEEAEIQKREEEKEQQKGGKNIENTLEDDGDDNDKKPEDNDRDDSDNNDDDEKPPVVKRNSRSYKKKHSKLTKLDIDSDEDDDANSDEDFKGSSSDDDEEEEDLDEEDDFSGSEDSSDMDFKRNRRGNNAPVRRSTRQRLTRYDKEFINDDTDDEEIPNRKKIKTKWNESESEEETDGSWGTHRKQSRKRNTSTKPRKVFWRPKKKKNRITSDNESDIEKKMKRRKIKYGLSDDDATQGSSQRRTRGKKINYLEALGSDSEEDLSKQNVKATIESEDEYVANEEEDEDEEFEDDEIKKSDSDNDEHKDVKDKETILDNLITDKTLSVTIEPTVNTALINSSQMPNNVLVNNLDEKMSVPNESIKPSIDMITKPMLNTPMRGKGNRGGGIRGSRGSLRGNTSMLRGALGGRGGATSLRGIRSGSGLSKLPGPKSKEAMQQELRDSVKNKFNETVKDKLKEAVQNKMKMSSDTKKPLMDGDKTEKSDADSNEQVSDDDEMDEDDLDEEDEEVDDEEDEDESELEDGEIPTKSLLSAYDTDELEELDEEELAELMAEEEEFARKQGQLKGNKLKTKNTPNNEMSTTTSNNNPDDKSDKTLTLKAMKEQEKLEREHEKLEKKMQKEKEKQEKALLRQQKLDEKAKQKELVNFEPKKRGRKKKVDSDISSLNNSKSANNQLNQSGSDIICNESNSSFKSEESRTNDSSSQMSSIANSTGKPAPDTLTSKSMGEIPGGILENIKTSFTQGNNPAPGFPINSPISGNFNPRLIQNTPPNFMPGVANPNIPGSMIPRNVNMLGVPPLIAGGNLNITDTSGQPTPPKRRGRGKGKKTLAAEAAAAAAKAAAEATASGLPVPSTTAAVTEPTKVVSSSAPSNVIGGKLGIAPPPQPFSQAQPTPSVITRMLQSQPVMPPSSNFNPNKFFNPGIPSGLPPYAGVRPPPPSAPGVLPPNQFRPPITGSNLPLYPSNNSPIPSSPQHRLPGPPPPGAPIYHAAHHPLDPSPSGGGTVSMPPPPATTTDKSPPPNLIPPTVSNPATGKSTSTPPPPPLPPPATNYSRINNLAAPQTAISSATGAPAIRHHIPPPFSPPGAEGNPPTPRSPANYSAPYHPPVPPPAPPSTNYHFSGYPPPAGDDALPAPPYQQGSPYNDNYSQSTSNAMDSNSQPAVLSENSNSKTYDEDNGGGGEFGGLVSYFSSQREDDIDS